LQNLPGLPKPKDAFEAAKNGYTFYKNLQSHDGHWAGEFGGPLFLLPGLVIGSYISGMCFKYAERLEMIRYIMNRAHAEDGGWGMCVSLPLSGPRPDFLAVISKVHPLSLVQLSITSLYVS